VTEVGDPDSVKGSYSVNLPDGRTQIVTYEVRPGQGYRAVVRYEGVAVFPTHPNKLGHTLKRQSKHLDSWTSRNRINDALFSEVYRDSRVRKQRKLPSVSNQDLDLSSSQNVVSATDPFQTNFSSKQNVKANNIPIKRKKIRKKLSPIKKIRVPVTIPKYVETNKPEKVFEIPIKIVEGNDEPTTTNYIEIITESEEDNHKQEENVIPNDSLLEPDTVTTTPKISEFETLKEIEEIGNTVTDEYDEDYFEDYNIFPFGSRLTSVILNEDEASLVSSLETDSTEEDNLESERLGEDRIASVHSGSGEDRIAPVHSGSGQPVKFVKTQKNTFVPEFYTT